MEQEQHVHGDQHEPIAKAEEVMREMKVDAVSVVSEEKEAALESLAMRLRKRD